MEKRSAVIAVILLGVGMLSIAWVSTPPNPELRDFGIEPASLRPMTLEPSRLAVEGPSLSAAYSGEQLETLPTHRLTTTTPWRDAPALFEGVLLADLLKVHGLHNASSIRVVATNDYATEIPREVWTAYPALIATRVDGAAHSGRVRGPLQIVFPMRAAPETGQGRFRDYWVWMAASISAAE